MLTSTQARSSQSCECTSLWGLSWISRSIHRYCEHSCVSCEHSCVYMCSVSKQGRDVLLDLILQATYTHFLEPVPVWQVMLAYAELRIWWKDGWWQLLASWHLTTLFFREFVPVISVSLVTLDKASAKWLLICLFTGWQPPLPVWEQQVSQLVGSSPSLSFWRPLVCPPMTCHSCWLWTGLCKTASPILHIFILVSINKLIHDIDIVINTLNLIDQCCVFEMPYQWQMYLWDGIWLILFNVIFFFQFNLCKLFKCTN